MITANSRLRQCRAELDAAAERQTLAIECAEQSQWESWRADRVWGAQLQNVLARRIRLLRQHWGISLWQLALRRTRSSQCVAQWDLARLCWQRGLQTLPRRCWAVLFKVAEHLLRSSAAQRAIHSWWRHSIQSGAERLQPPGSPPGEESEEALQGALCEEKGAAQPGGASQLAQSELHVKRLADEAVRWAQTSKLEFFYAWREGTEAAWQQRIQSGIGQGMSGGSSMSGRMSSRMSSRMSHGNSLRASSLSTARETPRQHRTGWHEARARAERLMGQGSSKQSSQRVLPGGQSSQGHWETVESPGAMRSSELNEHEVLSPLISGEATQSERSESQAGSIGPAGQVARQGASATVGVVQNGGRGVAHLTGSTYQVTVAEAIRGWRENVLISLALERWSASNREGPQRPATPVRRRIAELAVWGMGGISGLLALSVGSSDWQTRPMI